MAPIIEKTRRSKTAVIAGDVIPTKASEKVVEAINKGIRTRRFSAGHRLVEADLENSLKVSRGTVREALKKLAIQGIVLLSPYRGAEIRTLSRKEGRNLVAVLETLCGLAARLAASNIEVGGVRARFKKAADQLSGNSSDTGTDQFRADRAYYYSVMFEIADNPELNRLMPAAQIDLFRSQFHSFLRPKDIVDMRKEYNALSEAILQGNAELAEKRMRKHFQKTLNRLDAIGEEAFDQF